MEKSKLSIICLGCPKNLADLEYLISGLQNIQISNEEESEIVLINTCGFLKSARAEVIENIEALKDKKIIIIGCMASIFDEKLRNKYPQIFAVLSSANYEKLNNVILEASAEKKNFLISKEPNEFKDYDKKTLIYNRPYAYIKIAEGCNNKCGYCLIPYLKGKYRSRKMESIVKEAKDLIKAGIKEIILVAQDCGHYGLDIYKKKSLSELLKKLEKIDGDFWIRILYTYPEKVDKELIETIKQSKKICKYLDIPLQHGDPEILKAMGRPFDTKKTEKIIKTLRKEIPNISIRTSFIVGYPGESDKSFKILEKYLEKLEIDLVGVFEFSKEPHTLAYNLPNQVPSKTKKERREKLMILQKRISYNNNLKYLGSPERILVESLETAETPKKSKENKSDFLEIISDKYTYIGRSQRFCPEIDGNVYVESPKKLKIGTFVDVLISNTDEYDLYGELI